MVIQAWLAASSQRAMAQGEMEIEVQGPDGTMLSSGPGTVVAWGRNDYGQASVPAGLTGVRAVAAGDNHSLALLDDGSVVGWGRDDFGQATPPSLLTGVTGLAAGSGHSVALLADGTVRAWGRNWAGECNVPAGLGGVVQIAARTVHTLALRSDGAVEQWGAVSGLELPANLPPLRTLTTGQLHSGGMKREGGLVLWGNSNYGLTTVPDSSPAFVDVEAGFEHNAALRTDGGVFVWGRIQFGVTIPPPGLRGVMPPACGGYHCAVVTQDGPVVAWGDNAYGQTQVPAGLANVRALAAGLYHTLALVKPRSHVDAGTAATGIFAAPRTFTVRNTGTQPLHIRGVTLQGGQWPDFAVNTQGMASVVAPEETTVFTVQFRPLFRGLRSTVLRVETDDADEPWFEVELEGTGVATDPALSGITPGGTQLTPPFAPDTVTYTASVPYSTATMEVTATARSAGAQIQGRRNGGQWSTVTGGSPFGPLALNTGLNTIELLVTAEDGQTTRLYTLRVTRALPSTNANLSSLAISSGSLTPAFSPGVATYSVSLAHDIDSLTLTPRAEPTATMAVQINNGGFTVVAGNSSTAGLPLTPGLNTVVLRVTAQDGLTIRDYLLNVIRATAARINVALEGEGDLNGRPVPILESIAGSVPPLAPGARTFAIGDNHVTALMRDGTLVGWGGGTAATPPAGASGIVSIAAGREHTVALRSDGTVMAFGSNVSGQVQVPAGLTTVVGVGAGLDHSLAVRSNGTVTAWGSNLYGERNVPEDLTGVVAVDGGNNFSLALKSDGRVVAWGLNNVGQTEVPPDLSNVKAIATGDAHSLALLQDGTVRAWGTNNAGESVVPAGLSGVVAIGAGAGYSMALRSDGVVVVWGTAGLPANATGVTAIASGRYYFLTIGSPAASLDFGTAVNGTAGAAKSFVIRNTGNGDLEIYKIITGEPGVADFTLDLSATATRVPAGGETSFTVRFHPSAHGERRSMLQVFSNAVDENPFEVEVTGRAISTDAGLASLTTTAGPLFPAFAGNVSAYEVNAPAAATGFTITATAAWPLTSMAVSAAGGEFIPIPSGIQSHLLPLAPGLNLFSIRATAEDGGTVRFWTLNVYRGEPPQLWVEQEGTVVLCPPPSLHFRGFSSTGLETVPPGGPEIKGLAAGGAHALALRTNGTVLAWGSNTNGQSAVPPGLSDVAAVAAGASHSVALRSDGSVVAWGTNSLGQTAVPAGLTNVTGIASGSNHTLGVRRNGTVSAWGENFWGQSSVPGGMATAVLPAAGNRHSLVRVYGGGVQMWGDNSQGQRNLPPNAVNLTAVAAGDSHTLAINGVGTVIAWGLNTRGQTTVPSGLRPAVAVAAGTEHSLALLNDGRIAGWGSNLDFQTSFPAGLNASLIAASARYSLALGRILTPVDFGRPVIENPAPVMRTFTLKNTGGSPLHISSVAFAGSEPGRFALNTAGMLATLPPNGGETTFTAIYTNSVDLLEHYARVRIVTDAGSDPFDIMLTGAGVSNNASLSSVTVAGTMISPGFNSAVTSYMANVLHTQTTVSFTPRVVQTSATILFRMNGGVWRTVNSGASTGPEDLAVGTNLAEFKVTASDGVTQRLYTIAINRAALSGDRNLSSLSISAGGLIPGFQPGITSYIVETTNAVTQTNVTAVPSSSRATVSVRINAGVWAPGPWQLIIGANILEVLVTAEDGSTRTYTVDIRRPPAPEMSIEHPPGTVLGMGGTVVTWGDNTFGQCTVPSGLGAVRAITAGSRHTVALLSSGSVKSWGAVSGGAPFLTGGRGVAAGTAQALAIRDDGTVVAWGSASPVVPPGLTGITAVSGSSGHYLALRNDGVVFGWGSNAFGQTAVPPTLLDVIAVAAGGEHSMALKRDGTLTVWGSSLNGQQAFPPGADFKAIAAGDYWCLALKHDGTAVTWGNITPPGVFTNVAAISAYAEHALLLKHDGTVSTFGKNTYGQRNVPAGLKNVTAIAAGERHSAAVVMEPPVNYGTVPVGGTGLTRTFTVRNTGTALLNVSSAAFIEGNTGDFSVSGLPVSVLMNMDAAFTVTFSPLAPGVRAATLQLNNNDPDEGSYALFLTGTGVAAWDAWKQTNFGAVTDGTGPAEDFDGDGVINLLEFACGTDPRSNSPGELRYTGSLAGGGTLDARGQPVVMVEGENVRALYVRRKDRTLAGLTYTPQFSDDPGQWQDSANAGLVLAEDAGLEVVSIPFPDGTRFFRVAVQFTP